MLSKCCPFLIKQQVAFFQIFSHAQGGLIEIILSGLGVEIMPLLTFFLYTYTYTHMIFMTRTGKMSAKLEKLIRKKKDYVVYIY